MNIIAKKLMGGGNTLNYLLAAIIVLCGAQSLWAEDEIVDLGGQTVTKSASEFSAAYKDKIIKNGTVNFSNSPSESTAGKYTIGNGATVNFAAGPGFNGNWDLSIVDGGVMHQTLTSNGRMLLPFQYGQCTFTLDNGTFISEDGSNSSNARALNFGVIWVNSSSAKDKDISSKVVLRNDSLISLPNGMLLIGGARNAGDNKPKTLRIDFSVTDSKISTPKWQIQLGVNRNSWLNDGGDKYYTKAVFGPGADLTCKQIWADPDPTPSVVFDGATIHWCEGGKSFIGHNSALGDIYTIESNGLTIDIPEGKSLTCDTNASSLKGEGGITKIGEGSITWNNVSTGGSAGMTFTGPLVVSKGTWISILGYAASAFKANGGNLTLSGALSASKIELAATDGGKLTLSGATVTDAKPNMTLASNGTTDFFTRDNAVGTHTLGTLTLGEEAVLDLTGGDIGVDTVSADSLVLSATAAKPVTVKFSDAANIIGGSYTILAISGSGEFCAEGLAKFKLDTNAPEGSALSISGNKLILTVPSKNPATWTGGANDGKFSSVGNWLGNKVPGANDEVVINVDSETSLTCDVALNVKSITFHSLSAKVSIKGTGSIVIAESIANVSDARHVIDVPVEFKSADDYAPIDVTGEVDFQGGVKGTVPVNHTTFYGKYTLTATSWTLTQTITLAEGAVVNAEKMKLELDGNKLLCAKENSFFALKELVFVKAGDMFEAYLGTLQVSTLNCMKNSTSASKLNDLFKGVLRVNVVKGFVRSGCHEWNLGGDVVIGGTGIRSAGGGWNFGSSEKKCVLHSSADWTIENDYKNSPHNGYYNYGFRIKASSLDINTTDYDDSTIGRTVTVKLGDTKASAEDKTLLDEGDNSAAVSAFGIGTFAINNSCYFTGGFMAFDSVTVAVNKNAYPGKGNVTIKDTAIFSLVQANSGTVPVAGTLTMKGGTTLRIPEFTAGVLPLSVGALAFDGVTEESKVALNIESGALVEGYNAIIKAATTLPENAWDNFNVNLNEIVPAGMMPLYVAQGDTLYIVVKGANDAIWTGAGADAKFSTGSNWMGGQIPANGSCVHIAAAGETTLVNDINGFSPSSITFPVGSSAITIDGEAITGVVAITNLSTTTSHTINVPVYFAGDIQVKQAAMAEEGDLTKAHITFAGGAHAAEGCAIENGNFTAVYSRCMFGDYYLYPTAENPWSALNQGSGKRAILGANSALHVPYVGSLHELYIGSGSVVTAGVVSLTSSQRLSFKNYGEHVVTNGFTMAGSDKKDGFAGYNSGVDASNVFKIEKAICNKTDGYTFYFADYYAGSHGTYYIGAGGINFGTGNGYFGFGNNKDNDAQTIRPWYGDFTIAAGSGNDSKGYDIYVNRDVTFNTDDEKGVGRKITLNARLKFQNTPSFTVAGSGKVLVNSATTKSSAEPPVTVTDTATLALKPGAVLTKNSITVNEGATFEVAQSGTVSIEGTLSPVSGATLAFNFTDRKLAPVLEVATLDNENTDPNGIIWISISGLRPVGGQHVLTSGGVFGERQIKLLEERQPDWVKSVSCNANGEIVVDIKPIGTRIVVR